MVIESRSPEETEDFARQLALWIRPGFVVLLSGELGSGKSLLARALIRAVAGDPDLDVPSPSFSLVQTYDSLRVPLAHADLYRLKSEADVTELGLASLADSHGLIVEWPGLAPELERLAHVLSINLTGRAEQRIINCVATGGWDKALRRNRLIETFLAGHCGKPVQRAFMQGDASSRRYELVSSAHATELLMDMPRQPDGPPVKSGKPYSAVAHLAEDISSVIAINRHLSGMGYSAPLMRATDQITGLALVEQLHGDLHGDMMRRGDDMRAPMGAAIELLADMARHDWPHQVPADHGHEHVIHNYDMQAQLIETDLLVSWNIKHAAGKDAPAAQHESFDAVWRGLLPLAQADKPQWVLRDFHSPNLIWLPDRKGLARTGLIDTQDAVMGHSAYDVMSLLQDARCDVALDLHDALYEHYTNLRARAPGFDRAGFDRAYAVLGAQRACKLLGIFVRLHLRDGKSQYLQHLPRQKQYLNRNLVHPALAPLKAWLARELPELVT